MNSRLASVSSRQLFEFYGRGGQILQGNQRLGAAGLAHQRGLFGRNAGGQLRYAQGRDAEGVHRLEVVQEAGGGGAVLRGGSLVHEQGQPLDRDLGAAHERVKRGVPIEHRALEFAVGPKAQPNAMLERGEGLLIAF